MSTPQSVEPAEEVDLVCDVADGKGQTVQFRVAVVGAGDELARARWTVDAGDRALPLEVAFLASIAGRTVESAKLRVDPPGALGVAGWIIEQRGTAGPGDPKLGELEEVTLGGDPLATFPPAPAHQPFREGDRVLLRVEVGDRRRRPLTGNFELVFELQKEQSAGAGDYRTVKSFVRAMQASAPVDHALARWTASDLGLPPPHRFRFVVRWRKRAGEQGSAPDDLPPGVAS